MKIQYKILDSDWLKFKIEKIKNHVRKWNFGLKSSHVIRLGTVQNGENGEFEFL